jgi:hypothetical protein
MFVGHFAVALGAKRVEPKLPLATLVAAACGLDLLWPVLLLVGLETVRIDPGNTPFTPLDFSSYPWSHSLVMSLVWAALAGHVTRVVTKRMSAGLLVSALVFSHWALDFVTHGPDLPLWPGGPKVGLGLWNSIGATLVVEGAILAAGIAIYLRTTKPRDAQGRWGFWAFIVTVTAIWASQPFGAPPPSALAIGIVGAIGAVLFVAWTAWFDRHRSLIRTS